MILEGKKYLTSSSREVQGTLARILYEKCGPEVLPVIAEVFKEFGVTEGQKSRKKFQPADFAAAVKPLFGPSIEAGRSELVELTGTKVIIRGFQCVMGLQGAGKEVCQAIMALDKAMLSELAGKPLRMEIRKTMAAGDEHCEIEFEVE